MREEYLLLPKEYEAIITELDFSQNQFKLDFCLKKIEDEPWRKGPLLLKVNLNSNLFNFIWSHYNFILRFKMRFISSMIICIAFNIVSSSSIGSRQLKKNKNSNDGPDSNSNLDIDSNKKQTKSDYVKSKLKKVMDFNFDSGPLGFAMFAAGLALNYAELCSYAD